MRTNEGITGRLSRVRLQTLKSMATGMTREQIARREGIPVETYKSRVRAVLRMLDSQSQQEAVAKAYEYGILGGPQEGQDMIRKLSYLNSGLRAANRNLTFHADRQKQRILELEDEVSRLQEELRLIRGD